MAQQTINIGASPNDGTGTPLRTAFQYTNSNFSELYTAVGPSGNNIVVPGSATITGDLTVDTSTLKVDSANNQVGIGTANPGGALEVFKNTNGQNRLFLNNPSTGTGAYDAIDFTAGTANNQILSMGSGYSGSFPYLTGALLLRSAQANGIVLNTAGSAAAIQFGINDTLGMTLNATGLGVGGSPSAKLSVTGGNIRIDNNQGVEWGGANNYIYGSEATDFIAIVTNGVEALRINNSQNVGVGVTPSAWGSNYKSVQTLLGAALAGKVDGLFLAQNCYYDGTNWVNNRASTYSARYDMNVAGNSVHAWYVYNGVFGSAGNTIPFTQAMTLDASGNLLVGTTSLIAGSASGSLNIVGANTQQIQIRNSSATAGEYWRQAVDSSNTIYILNNASTGVSITSGATSWSAVSDERLKDIIEPIGNAVAKVGSLRSVIGKYKSDSEGTRRSFLIAQDVQSVLPEAVDTTNADAFGVRYSEVIPLLVAAIKELTARVQTLEAK